MRYQLKLVNCQWEMGNHEQMLYTDDRGELFIGPAKDVRIGKTYEVEVDEKLLGTCYRHIIAWLDEPKSGQQ
jgi:hypothetical protein